MTNPSIIINEFLTFVQNKIDILDEISIVQICTSNFTESEIETGKSVLFESLPGGGRNVMRKGEDKSKKNVKDIIKQLKETDPILQPSFVAKDLNRLPPISFDSIDVSKLLRDVACVKAELSNIRNDTVTKAEMMSLQTKISSDLTSLRSCFKPQKTLNRNAKLDSPQPVPEPKESLNKIIQTPKRSALVKECTDKRLLSAPAVQATSLLSSAEPHTPSYRDIIVQNVHNGSDGFIPVVNKKRKQRSNLCGTAKSMTKIQVAELSSAIYISRIKKSTTVDDIKEHITEMGQSCSDIQLLEQHRETEFNSYKIIIARSKLAVFLNNEFWPEGIKFRPFREYLPRGPNRNFPNQYGSKSN